jgi:hypothetical protein
MAVPEILFPARRPDRVLGRPVLAAVTVTVAVALLGVPAGFCWVAFAPRVVVLVTGSGAAQVLNPETKAFIAADGWFCVIGAVAGLLAAVVGYLVTVRRHGGIAVAGLMLGGLGASLVQWWIGRSIGLASFRTALLLSRAGAILHAPLMLRAHGAVVIWPLTTAVFICLVELITGDRPDRSAAPGQLIPAAPSYGTSRLRRRRGRDQLRLDE